MDQKPSLEKLKNLIPDSKNSTRDWSPVLDEILTIMGCQTGTLHFLDTDSGLLTLAASANIPEFLMPKIMSIPVGKGIAGAAAERRDAVQMCNLQTDTSGTARPDAKKTEVAGSLAVPVLDGDTLVGTLGVGMPTPHEFTKNETATLWEISRLIAPALIG